MNDSKITKLECSRRNSNSQRLKKSKKFAFGNSPITRQHNMSLNGTKSKIIIDRVCRQCFINNLACNCRTSACQCDANIACNCKARWAFPKEVAFW